MSAQAYADKLARALDSTELLETVRKGASDNQINILSRVKPNKEGEWISLITNMLSLEQLVKSAAYSFQLHICRHYFLKNSNLVFGWNITVQSDNMPTSLDHLIHVIDGGNPEDINGTPENSEEITEMPLSGATENRNQSKTGKGAYTIGGKSDFRPFVRR